MRLKLYYTTDEITNNLYTSGSQYMLQDNTEYRGLYHTYITGEVYTEATWNAKTSIKLVPYKRITAKNTEYETLKRELKLTYTQPVSALNAPTAEQLKAGSYTRYFIKKVNESKIIEIDESQFALWQSKQFDPVMYTATKMQWYISGPIDDTRTALVLHRGVRTKNLDQIAAADATITGISKVLTDPLQYYSDITYLVPKDINQ
ncbi:hypothetical protein UFOVP1307_205 [uncultured Caudovirales phage]|uniref:Uncharacterized protein n=1 Tax=uncultured Caudovirales phage TaxID=2100421 RepID=A0A6J5PH29_9CAUD|nr:hypothetical protein UFOVP651_141 [uncultured Caudovirales phage]CAB4171159.1 hypothetical protein UFOVP902_220 [uncultured Caudovirales phage]CAB4198670.1 hypothetical protein UFOVP1307_205 [uncultured Caudovirales phage]